MTTLTPPQQRLVDDNLGLIRFTLRRVSPARLAGAAACGSDDLFQEGVLGLIRAAQRFDPHRHGAFSSFAVPHIAGALRRALAQRCDTIGVQRRRSSRSGIVAPRVFRVGRGQRLADRAPRDADEEERQQLLREALLERSASALSAAADRAAGAAHSSPRRRLVESVLRRRLLTAPGAARPSLRALARELRCAPAAVHKCEKRLTRLAREYLARDPVAPRLLAARVRSPADDELSPGRLRGDVEQRERDSFDAYVARLDRRELGRLLGELAVRAPARGERLAQELFDALDRRDRARVLMRFAANEPAAPGAPGAKGPRIARARKTTPDTHTKPRRDRLIASSTTD